MLGGLVLWLSEKMGSSFKVLYVVEFRGVPGVALKELLKVKIGSFREFFPFRSPPDFRGWLKEIKSFLIQLENLKISIF